jgi:hypothetical protein
VDPSRPFPPLVLIRGARNTSHGQFPYGDFLEFIHDLRIQISNFGLRVFIKFYSLRSRARVCDQKMFRILYLYVDYLRYIGVRGTDQLSKT